MIFVFGVYFWQQTHLQEQSIFYRYVMTPQEKMLSEGIQADEVSLETQSFWWRNEKESHQPLIKGCDGQHKKWFSENHQHIINKALYKTFIQKFIKIHWINLKLFFWTKQTDSWGYSSVIKACVQKAGHLLWICREMLPAIFAYRLSSM